MRLALAAGGTGGHMFPAQALAEEAKERGWSILLLTDARGKRYIDGFPADDVVELAAASPSAAGLGAKFRAGITLLGGVRQAGRAMAQFQAQGVVGFGGYPSAPSMLAAQRRKLPTGLHEQNAVLGRANRLAAGQARFLAHGFPVLTRAPSKARLIETGNPVRQAVLDAAATAYADPNGGPVKIVIFGGSQGASLFARVFPSAFASLPEHPRSRLDIVHQAADADLESAERVYSAAGIRVELAPFFSDLPRRLAESHLVIARSGASTVTELAVIGRPSILIPLKIAMDDHQRVNADVLVDAGAAVRILEDDLAPQGVVDTLTSLLSEPQRLTRMAEAAKGRMVKGAAGKLADLIEERMVTR
ncbi:MAG: undecaprenyldiphospho-muramoylpentapeptide beta-N-acetylglucosaminyltransferase [Pseudomonadota bacterium]